MQRWKSVGVGGAHGRSHGRKTDFFGVGSRLSLTPRFSGVDVAREHAPQPLQRFTVVGKPLKRF
jgi:hypothetical protein